MDYDSVINSYLDQEQSQLSDMTVKISEYLEERLSEQYAYEHDDEFESLYRFSEEKIAEIIPQLSEEKSVGALAKWLDKPEHGAEIMEEFKKHLLSVEIFDRRLTKEETEKLLPDGKWGSAAEEFIADMLKPPGQEELINEKLRYMLSVNDYYNAFPEMMDDIISDFTKKNANEIIGQYPGEKTVNTFMKWLDDPENGGKLLEKFVDRISQNIADIEIIASQYLHESFGLDSYSQDKCMFFWHRFDENEMSMENFIKWIDQPDGQEVIHKCLMEEKLHKKFKETIYSEPYDTGRDVKLITRSFNDSGSEEILNQYPGETNSEAFSKWVDDPKLGGRVLNKWLIEKTLINDFETVLYIGLKPDYRKNDFDKITDHFIYEFDQHIKNKMLNYQPPKDINRLSHKESAQISATMKSYSAWLNDPQYGRKYIEEISNRMAEQAMSYVSDIVSAGSAQEQSLSDISGNMKSAQGNNVFVLSEQGYRHRAAKGLNDIKPGQSFPEYKNNVPKSWAEKGWVKEVSPDALPEIQKNQSARVEISNNRQPIIELEP